MKKVDLSQIAIANLRETLKDEQNALDKMRFTHSISPVDNPKRIQYGKKSIARLFTEIRKREIEEIKK